MVGTGMITTGPGRDWTKWYCSLPEPLMGLAQASMSFQLQEQVEQGGNRRGRTTREEKAEN
jgi:hypothetical protein